MVLISSPRIQSFRIDGLFGTRSYEVSLNTDSPVTIISGPNGVGKTHMLQIVRGILALDYTSIADEPFKSATLNFRSPRKSLTVTKLGEDGDGIILYEGRNDRSPNVDKFQLTPNDFTEDEEESFPPWLITLPDGRFFDRRMNRVVPRSFLEKRYKAAFDASRGQVLERNPWLKRILGSAPIMIDTQRLGDLVSAQPSSAGSDARFVAGGGTRRRVSQYISQVKVEINEAQRESLNASQKADRTFASRVLQKARSPIKEQELRERYQRIADQHLELYSNGLASESVDVAFPDSKTNPTERRILNVFLDDWERRLQPLLPVNQKLKTLRRIINGKLSGKEMVVDRQGNLRFFTEDKEHLQVRQLSSGEQHLLALFTVLLFSAQPGAVVLIDEPEISMHAAWKHEFLDDIVEVSNIACLQILVATHSTSIINGQWQLVHEIGV